MTYDEAVETVAQALLADDTILFLGRTKPRPSALYGVDALTWNRIEVAYAHGAQRKIPGVWSPRYVQFIEALGVLRGVDELDRSA